MALAAVGQVQVQWGQALYHLVERPLHVLAGLAHLQVVLRAKLAQALERR